MRYALAVTCGVGCVFASSGGLGWALAVVLSAVQASDEVYVCVSDECEDV